MKKLSNSIFLALSLTSFSASAAVTVNYYNRDSQKYIYPARCSGSQYSLSVQGGTTGTATIQGSSPCTVKSAGSDVVLKGGEKIEIKDGKIIVK